MIVGNGNIAKVLTDRENFIFFASGVSDSSCNDVKDFNREVDLLLKQDRNKHLVYFSNLIQYRLEGPYIWHKRRMEREVKKHFPYNTIVRVEVCEWAQNPTTIHNVFRRLISEGKEPQIQNTFRYVLSKNEFLYWLSLIKFGESGEMNIPGKRYTIKQIYNLVKNGKL